MLRKPSINPRFRLRTIDADRVLLSHETGFRVLHGRPLARLAPLIDGTRTTGQLADALGRSLDPVAFWFGLTRLEEEGCLEESDADEPVGVAAFRSLWGVSRTTLGRRLARTAIALSAVPPLSTGALATVLESLGVRVAPRDDAHLTVVLTDDYLREELDDIDRQQRAHGRPWLPVKPVGSLLWLGPLVQPGRRPCWACLRDRLASNRPEQEWLRRHGGRQPDASRLSTAALASTSQAAVALVGTQVLRWIARPDDHPLANCLVVLDPGAMTTQRHHVVAMPGCRACSGKEAARCEPRGIVIHHGAAVSRDNGYRVVSPEETAARLSPLVSRISGIIGDVECRTPNDSLVHFYVADHVFEPALSQPDADRAGWRHLSAGKGTTATQARASAMCEAIERYSGVFRGDERLVKGRLDDISGAIHPNRCLGFSARQYAHRRGKRPRHLFIPEPFDERAVIDWAPVWSLTGRRWRYLPAAYCYYGYPGGDGREYCRPDSNGCAAGNTREEAILQGLLELVERDAVAMWWYNRARRPGVALETFPGSYVRSLVGHYVRRLHRAVHVLDLTNDFGLPTFIAISRQAAPRPPAFIAGVGTHCDATVALSRALTEMNQFLPAMRDGHVEQGLRVPRGGLAFLDPDPRLAARRFEDFPEPTSDDVGVLVRRCVALAASRGLETLVLDQTRAEVGLPVVRVVVPGLRHFYPRLAPGRLYDVPVALGWLPGPRQEQSLNPVPFVL